MWDLIVSVPDHCLSFYFPLLHSRLQNHLYSWVNTKISLELAICQCVQIYKVFRLTPTLFDGDYSWHKKHDASQSGIILLHFDWVFLI